MRTPPNGQPVDGISIQRARIFRPSTPITAQTGLLPSFLTDNREPGGQAAVGTGSETTPMSIAKENEIRDDGDVMVTSQHSCGYSVVVVVMAFLMLLFVLVIVAVLV